MKKRFEELKEVNDNEIGGGGETEIGEQNNLNEKILILNGRVKSAFDLKNHKLNGRVIIKNLSSNGV